MEGTTAREQTFLDSAGSEGDSGLIARSPTFTNSTGQGRHASLQTEVPTRAFPEQREPTATTHQKKQTTLFESALVLIDDVSNPLAF